MRIDIMTLFPDSLGDVLSESILGRAQERGFIRIEAHQIRDYTASKQCQVDDYPYGGGRGAILQADPLYRCWEHVCDEAGGPVHTIFLSPCGHVFRQADAIRLSRMENLVLVCGHYGGLTSGLLTNVSTRSSPWEILSSPAGEIAAMAVTDAVCRMVPGVLADPRAFRRRAILTACWSTRSTAVLRFGTACRCRRFCCPETMPRWPGGAVNSPSAGPRPAGPICFSA